ncbi:NAD-dependent epimerase/dehydratase family protein [Adhaeribacter radiodurans]|uniref:NAD-dependent epimerase/dehydratase family protein n=1 Tax=Adhaeribacter radiodurans TaxID=2745197 RepID=A0A7L7LFN2_9BACT|nr:NAD-dependent epimerase/dehydratase family protein [Adhaeribacter radiodurans]QMU31325.1 NAD-dependent epimerase/dehydratase family protein [Adhaeribacter radiodurans]
MVFVTGSRGLIGSYLLRQLLAEGHQVKALIRTEPTPDDFQHPNLKYIVGDILDVSALQLAIENNDYIFHCAGLVSYAPQDADLLKQINVEGTANIVNTCLARQNVKLCHVSSIAAIGQQKNTNILNENAKWDPQADVSVYASSKYFGELEVWRGVAEGLAAVIVNPSVVLGPSDWTRSSTQLFKYVFNQNSFYTGGYLNFVDVRDVVSSMLALTFSDVTGERFILNAGQVLYKEFFTNIAINLNRKAPGVKVPSALAEVIWRLESLRSFFTGKRPLITKDTARITKRNYFFTSEKLKKQLAFSFKSLEETLNWSCRELRLKYQLPV